MQHKDLQRIVTADVMLWNVQGKRVRASSQAVSSHEEGTHHTCRKCDQAAADHPGPDSSRQREIPQC